MYPEVFDRPELAGAPKTHLNLIDYQKNSVLVEYLLEALVEVRRWDHVAAGTLDRLHVEGCVLALLGFRIPDRVVLVLELARKLANDGFGVFLGRHALGATKRIWERDELRAVAEVAEAPAVAVAGRNA
ncbi:hypothetical protein D3C71_1316300 [compost metagenome]